MNNFKIIQVGIDGEDLSAIVGRCGTCARAGRDSGENSLIWMKSKKIRNRTKMTVTCVVCMRSVNGEIESK